MRITVRRLLVLFGVVALLAGCGSTGGSSSDGTRTDPTPEKLDGSSSQEFEPDDIERSEGASDAVKEYCSGAVSEAQRVGCESHVDESDIP